MKKLSLKEKLIGPKLHIEELMKLSLEFLLTTLWPIDYEKADSS